MDFTWNQIMDVALNVAGYLAAGSLAVLVYRMANRSPAKEPPSPVLATNPTLPLEQYAAPERPTDLRDPRMQFVSLAGETPAQTPDSPSASPTKPKPRPATHRQRAEVIKLARQMVAAGATNENIQKVLPVSETELALLKLGNNR
jgi:hypothetical protein